MPRLKLGARATVKLPLPQYSSSRSASELPRVTPAAHVSIFSHMRPFGWLKPPSTCARHAGCAPQMRALVLLWCRAAAQHRCFSSRAGSQRRVLSEPPGTSVLLAW